jgi:hypothetical protein
MKTERRHELETNTLAKGLNDWGERLRPYHSAILAGIALLLLAYIGASMWSAYRATRERAAWEAYEMAVLRDDSELKMLQQAATGGDFDGTDMQEWAYISWADRQLHQASLAYLTDREGANERLDAISAVYKQYAENSSSPEIRNRARLGLARVDEMKNRPDEARQQYAKVDGALAAVAEARIKELDAKGAKETIAWLASAELPSPSSSRGPGIPGVRPPLDPTAPAPDATDAPLGDVEMMDKILGGIGADETEDRYPEGAEPATPPADSSESPATTPESPAAETPAAEPSAEETPAAETPAATAPAEAPAETPAAEPAEKPAATEPASPPAESTPAAPS